MRLPSHYRKLHSYEVIKNGDYYVNPSNPDVLGKVNSSVGHVVSEYNKNFSNYDFYRRRHVKAKSPLKIVRTKSVAPSDYQVVAKKSVNQTVVKFLYKNKTRRVQLISMDNRYLTGLEIYTNSDGVTQYQFKNFLRSRMETPAVLEAFGPR